MTLDEQIAILQALKEGKKIEGTKRFKDGPEIWAEWQGLLNFTAYEYRIVPEPRRWVIYRLESGCVYAAPYEHQIVSSATIICTATEDTNLGEAAAPYLEALKEKISRP